MEMFSAYQRGYPELAAETLATVRSGRLSVLVNSIARFQKRAVALTCSAWPHLQRISCSCMTPSSLAKVSTFTFELMTVFRYLSRR